ncbi:MULTISPECIES: hypothetical protein [Sphingobium]|jgi:hypothetical protein|uniref:Phasin family protein n=2 Tax=Sphingobium TaxID=165695 RepID=A0A5B8CBK4_SPHSA|nr:MULTISPECIES: hypothetical protein [Sphingobium]QDC36583.1 hypothetical protein FIL70_04305 [Sphingobium fuliginis ATCC 27551]QNG43930.1 hypothetical protein H3V42_18690 [Sphingobium yanoikuyae]
MTYPFDQLGALTKANSDLSIRLAEIARHGAQGGMQSAAAIVNTLGEVATPEFSPEKKVAALSEKGANILRDAEKVREQMIADTRAALQTWQEAWSAAAVLPVGTGATDAFRGLMRMWRGVASGGEK